MVRRAGHHLHRRGTNHRHRRPGRIAECQCQCQCQCQWWAAGRGPWAAGQRRESDSSTPQHAARSTHDAACTARHRSRTPTPPPATANRLCTRVERSIRPASHCKGPAAADTCAAQWRHGRRCDRPTVSTTHPRSPALHSELQVPVASSDPGAASPALVVRAALTVGAGRDLAAYSPEHTSRVPL